MNGKLLEEFAFKEGFRLFGGINLKHLANYSEYAQLFSKRLDYYAQWLNEKKHGEMAYLERGLERRKNFSSLLEGAKSVFVFGLPYGPKAPTEYQQSDFKISSYITQTFGENEYQDYHAVINTKIWKILDESSRIYPPLKGKVCVDTSAVLEKALAEVCGLGWYGKNTLLLNSVYGSYFFIGVLILNQELDESLYPLPKIHPNYCGNCRACLKNCPTEAFPNAYQLDARKCISYLTLENRLDFSTPLFGWVAGCDICQQVCPFNKKVLVRGSAPILPEDWPTLKEAWITEDESSYKKRVKETALSRVKPKMMKRNLRNS